MTTTNSHHLGGSSRFRGPAAHLFAVGQLVHLKFRFGQPLRFADVYRVTEKLPARDDSPQYRIRNDSEPHERMVAQSSLLLAGLALSKEKRRGNREIRKPKQQETPPPAPERAAGKPNAAPKVPDAPSRKGTYRPA